MTSVNNFRLFEFAIIDDAIVHSILQSLWFLIRFVKITFTLKQKGCSRTEWKTMTVNIQIVRCPNLGLDCLNVCIQDKSRQSNIKSLKSLFEEEELQT